MTPRNASHSSLWDSWRALLRSPRVQAAFLLLAPILLVMAAFLFAVKTDPDYWWHVRTGQYIYETGGLPRGDIYSYTRAGQPWVTHEWLTEVAFYVVARWGGYVTLAALFSVITVLTWGIVYATCRRWAVGEVGATLLMVWGFAMAAGSLNVRPQGLTTLLLAVCALVVTRYRQGESRLLYLLPPLFALWVNLHGGYTIGLILLALAVVGQAADVLLKRSSAPLRPLVLATVLCALATLLNPHGLTALVYPFSYAGAENASMRYIQEWQSPDFHNPYFLIFAASLLLAVVLGLMQRPLGAVEVLWTVGFAFLALRSARHLPLYAVVVTPLLGARLQAEIPIFRQTLEAWRTKWLLALIWPSVIILALALAVRMNGAVLTQVGREPSEASYPSGAVAYLREHDINGNLFNEYDWGGYLIYQMYPQRPVFIDGRADVYGDAFAEQYVQVVSLNPSWRSILDDYDVSLALVRDEGPLAVVLADQSDWQEVYAGDVERLFVRKP